MHVLVMDQVGRSYPPRRGERERTVVLRQIDLRLAPGETVALVGRSGAGKTTLLHLAAGLARPTRGRILFEGRDYAALRPAELARTRRRIGLVFQNNLTLSALNVWENAALPLLMDGMRRDQARRAAVQALDAVGLAAMADAPTETLSGGQRRRLGLVRALIGSPSLLLADEPTADLDVQTARVVETLLAQWLQQRRSAAIIVTHEPSLERMADRVLRLEDGILTPADADAPADGLPSSGGA